MASKGRTKDKTLSKLGSRLITTMLKSERQAEKELEQQMKSLKTSERKSMLKIGETSLEVKYDFRRKRNAHIMEEENAENLVSAGFGQEMVARSPSFSRRESYNPVTVKQSDDNKHPRSQERSVEGNIKPTIFINNERKNSTSDDNVPGSRRSSCGSAQPDAPSPCGTTPNEAAEDQAYAHQLKVFSQSAQSRRRRTAPEIADLSPKLLIQMAKSSAEVKRRGSSHDVAATAACEELSGITGPLTKRRGSPTVEGLLTKSEHSYVNSETEEKLETSQTLGNNVASSLRRRGSSNDERKISPSILRRRGSSSVTNAKPAPLSLRTSETLLCREKICDQVPLSPRLQQPQSPLRNKRESEGVSTLRQPHSPQTIRKRLSSDYEQMNGDSSSEKLPDLKPSSRTLYSSLTVLRAVPSLSRPSSARSLSAEERQDPCYSPDDSDFTRRRGSRPVSARSCHSLASDNLLSPESLANRRGSDLSPIVLNSLSPNSALRKAMEDPKSTLNPAPVSPRMLRRHSSTVEVLQDRVDDFLKTLTAKSA